MKLKYEFFPFPESTTDSKNVIYDLSKYDTLHILSDDFLVLDAATDAEMIFVPASARKVHLAIQKAINERTLMVYLRVVQREQNSFVTDIFASSDLLRLNSPDHEP